MEQINSILSNTNLYKENVKVSLDQIRMLTQKCKALRTATSSHWSTLNEDSKMLQKTLKEKQHLEKLIVANQEKVTMLEVALETLRYENEIYLQSAEKRNDREHKTQQLALHKATILGIKYSFEDWNKDACTVKFSFTDCQYIIVIYNIVQDLFILKHIEPKHPRFDDLKKFLNITNDFTGFLAALQKYFKK